MSSQHIIPQMMIKRFAGADGKLIEFFKPTLSFGTKRKRPKGILFQDDFYIDRFSDFDDDLLKPIENTFAKYYPAIADSDPPSVPDGHGGAALVNWIAAMLCRTRSLVCLAVAATLKNGNPAASLAWIEEPALMANAIRETCFRENQDLLSRPGFCWNMRLFEPSTHIVLTDNPVLEVSICDPLGPAVVVPISKNRVLIGGPSTVLESWRSVTCDYINDLLAAWAGRSIFAAYKPTLEQVQRTLLEGDSEPDEWTSAARQPFFGLPSRILGGENQPPKDVDQWWEQMKAQFGESIVR